MDDTTTTAPPLAPLLDAPLAPLDAPHGDGNREPQHEDNREPQQDGTRDPHGDGGEWLTINAAARALGVTATAIRNRIKRGTLQARPNGNFGKLVFVPLTRQQPVTLTVSGTPEETVPLPVTLTLLRDHIETLKAALAKAESELEVLRPEHERAERLAVEAATVPGLKAALAKAESELEVLRPEHERAERLAVEAATVPGLRTTLASMRVLLEMERSALTEAHAERERLLARSWWRRLVG